MRRFYFSNPPHPCPLPDGARGYIEDIHFLFGAPGAQFVAQALHRFVLGWMDAPGRDLGQRLEHKPAVDHFAVRYRQRGAADNTVAPQQNIYVDGPRAPAADRRLSAERPFNAFELQEGIGRCAGCADRDDGIYKFSLARPDG